MLDVTPVWSEKALAGIGREALPVVDEPPPAAVVVVDDELVELQAAAPSPTASTIVSAVVRLFQEPERKAPPMSSLCSDGRRGPHKTQDPADTDM
ncbi:MAG TPA: hypothetical protein VII96_02625 [Acidimicrobiales bacterium]